MRLDPAHFRQAIGNQAPVGPIEFNREHFLAREVVGYWSGWEGTGPALRDIAGGRNAVIDAGVNWTANVFGGWALDFPGDNRQAAIVPAAAEFNIATDITLACWIKRDVVGDNLDAYGGLIAKTNGTSQWDYDFYLGVGAAADRLDLYSDGAGVITSTGTITDTNVHHVAFTRIGNSGRFYIDGIDAGGGTFTGNFDNRTNDLWFGSDGLYGTAIQPGFNGNIWHTLVVDRGLSPREIASLYDPATRWNLTREARVPRVWPGVAGGAVSRTAIGSLQAALRRQTGFLASADAALRAEAVLSALAGAAVEKRVSGVASLDLAIQLLGQAQADLDTALIRALGFDIGLDANLSIQGVSQRAAALDSAVQQLDLLSAALQAALRAPNLDTAALDAWLGLSLGSATGLDAVAQRGGQLASTALQGILRVTPGRAAALDAIIGLVVSAAASRTQKIGARGGHTVAGGQRQSVIPSGNRRH